MLLYACSKLPGSISSACCGNAGQQLNQAPEAAAFQQGQILLLLKDALELRPQQESRVLSAPSIARPQLAARLVAGKCKFLRATTSNEKQELQALVASLSIAGAKGWECPTFTTAQELLSAAKWYLAVVRGSFPHVLFLHLEIPFVNFPFLQGVGCYFIIFFS